MKRKITQLFLRGRFSTDTEQKVQQWLAAGGDDPEASREFWESLKPAKAGDKAAWRRVAAKAGIGEPKQMRKRRWVAAAASVVIVLSAAAGGLVWRAQVADAPKIEATQPAPTVLLHPLAFEGATAEQIFEELEERFSVEIIADLPDSGELYTVKFPKGDNLTSILRVLQDVVGGFTYTRNGDKITIKASASEPN